MQGSNPVAFFTQGEIEQSLWAHFWGLCVVRSYYPICGISTVSQENKEVRRTDSGGDN